MKYGLLYYKNTDNIGDDIQAYAAERFLPRVDYLIDREDIESFVPAKKETVATIMNAWYVHDKFNFAFSPYIKPLFISMFFKRFPYEDGITVGTSYFNQNVINNLTKYGPVGTRDLHTKAIMEELKIDNYFSGCMTLTLEKFKDVKKQDYIVTVGLKKEEIEFIKSRTNRKVIEFIQDISYGTLSELKWEERKIKVEEVLKLYQGAHMVITNKLHCTLPCLALSTPVLLLYDFSFKENEDRIGTYLEYVNSYERCNFINSDVDFEHPKSNPKKYLKIRNNLISKCKQFIDDKSLNDNLPEIHFYSNIIMEQRNMRKNIIDQLTLLQKKYVDECSKSSMYYDKYEEEVKKNKELNDELLKIKNTKFYKFYNYIRKK